MRPMWRDRYKSMELAWMNLKDDYSELVRIMYEPQVLPQSFWGDPLSITHETAVRRLREIMEVYSHVKPSETGEGAAGTDGGGPKDLWGFAMDNPSDAQQPPHTGKVPAQRKAKGVSLQRKR